MALLSDHDVVHDAGPSGSQMSSSSVLPEADLAKDSRQLCVRHKQMANQNVNAKLQKVSTAEDSAALTPVARQPAGAGARGHYKSVVDVFRRPTSQAQTYSRGVADNVLFVSGLYELHADPSSQLSHLSDSLNRIIRIDPFSLLPREVSLKILGFLDAFSLGRAAQVSCTWKALADDDLLWRRMCGQHIDRKCEKCGWGLPLLERRRLKVELNDRSPAAAMGVGGHDDGHHHGHDVIQQLMTRSEALGVNNASHKDPRSVACDPAAPTPGPLPKLKRSEPSSPRSGSWGREKIRRLDPGSDSDEDAAHPPPSGMLSRDVRLTRPWKSVYCERLVVERNWRKGRCQTKRLAGHTDGVMCLQYHTVLTAPHYPVLITGSYDRTIRIWNLDTGELVRVLKGHLRAVRALQFDQMVLFTGSMDGTVRMWNWRKGECMRVFEGHNDGVVSLNYNGYLLASGSVDSTIIVRNFRSSTQFKLQGHTDWVNSLLLWDGKTSPGDLDPVNTASMFTQALKPKTDATSGPDMDPVQLLFSASDDFTVKLWDLNTKECIRTFEGHQGQVQSLRVLMIDQPSNDGGDEDKEGTPPPQSSVVCGTLSPQPAAPDNAPDESFDAHALVTSSHTEHITPRVYVHSEETARKKKESTVEREEKRACLATGSLDGTVRIWDVESGKEKSTLFGHIEGVWSVDMDALRLASASQDRTIKVWDRESSNCVQTLVGHRGTVTSLQLSDDMIVSGSEDGDVMVWSFAPGAAKSPAVVG